MIFVSHNSKDKPVVEQIALRLADTFGKESVFYDSWSIQPGDGIIDRMNSGLSGAKFFFYFVSKNSLASKMVDMEWQNALIKATGGQMKFVPVRLDDSTLPPLLQQNLYIDLYTNGLEVAIRQIVDVCQGQNTFQPRQVFSNISWKAERNGLETTITVSASHYMEPVARFLLCMPNTIKEDFKIEVPGIAMYESGFWEGAQFDNGFVTNAQLVAVERALVPGFPLQIKLTDNPGKTLHVERMLHAKSATNWQQLPRS